MLAFMQQAAKNKHSILHFFCRKRNNLKRKNRKNISKGIYLSPTHQSTLQTKEKKLQRKSERIHYFCFGIQIIPFAFVYDGSKII